MISEMETGAVRGSAGNCPTAEETPRETHLGDLLKAVLPVIASNGVPYLQMRDKEREREREKKGGEKAIAHMLTNQNKNILENQSSSSY